MSQEDAVALIKQLNDDKSLTSSIQAAQHEAIAAEARKTGLDVTVEDLKTVVSGAQKGGGFDLKVPGWLEASGFWD